MQDSNNFEDININKIIEHFDKIYSVNKNKFLPGMGSYLFNGKKYEYDSSMYEKQKLLYNLCKKNSDILEIGVYMGHSILIMLLANPKINIKAIEINGTYSVPSVNYLKTEFPKAKINLIIKNSIDVLINEQKKFDLFHIDGDHNMIIIYKEFLYCIHLRKDDNFNVLFDDVTHMQPLKRSILKNFECKIYEPKSAFPNFYIEIKINKTNLKKQINNFKIDFLKFHYRYIFISSFYKIFILYNPFGKILIKTLEKNIFYKKIKSYIKSLIN